MTLFSKLKFQIVSRRLKFKTGQQKKKRPQMRSSHDRQHSNAEENRTEDLKAAPKQLFSFLLVVLVNLSRRPHRSSTRTKAQFSVFI